LLWNRFNIHAEIHKHTDSIPEPVKEFYRYGPDESFYEKVILLEERLIAYGASTNAQEYFKQVFLGLCHYFMGRKSYLACLEKAEAIGLYPEFLPLIVQLKYEIKRAERTLIIVSYDDALNRHVTKLKRINEHISVIPAAIPFDIEDMLRSWNKYDQVFLLGHGEDKTDTYEGHITLGDKVLTPSMLISYILANPLHPRILGIFSCGEAFNTAEIKSHFDFFMTDRESSVPVFAEMFLYGYLQEYYQRYKMDRAFQCGKLATIFRAKSDPTYEIYLRGVTLQ
jgi:hypothetical protein